VSFQIDGVEKLRWHYGNEYPRPFFFPFNGPSGVSLTRMGHPGASNHDHHRSIWFAHHDVNGVDFWSDNTESRIRQKQGFFLVPGETAKVYALTGIDLVAHFDKSEPQFDKIFQSFNPNDIQVIEA
jgi:hypothetical protein